MATPKTPPPDEAPAEEPVDQQQVVPMDGVPEDRPAPEDWSEPGWKEGMFPGDPNTYPDPENPAQSY